MTSIQSWHQNIAYRIDSAHVEITPRGKRAGIVVPPERYDRAVESLETAPAPPATEESSYAKLVGKVPQVLRMAREGASEGEQDKFDKEQIAPLHEQLGHEQH